MFSALPAAFTQRYYDINHPGIANYDGTRNPNEKAAASGDAPAGLMAGSVVINEFLAKNVNGETDEVGQHEDWLELYNNDDIEHSLNGIYLTDDPAKPDKWLFPLNTSIAANGFLIIWLDEDPTQGPLHANFKLNNNGEFLMLSNGAGSVIDSLSFGAQRTDTTFGRYPNGTGAFTFMPRTFNAVNSLTVSSMEPEREPPMLIFPNPASDWLTVESALPLGRIGMFDMLGRELVRWETNGSKTAYLDVKDLPEGLYCLKAGNNAAAIVIVQHR